MLEAYNIHKVYTDAAKQINVLKGISFSVEKGKFISLVGPSGAGKSTLLHILGGLDSPSQGSVSIAGESLYNLGDYQLARLRNKKIGFVFQFYHLLSEFTVLENVIMPALIGNAGSKKNSELEGRALELLAQVGLGDRIRHFPSQLSGGEQQRVAIARALINQPEILLCDEPTGNLDSKSGEGVIGLIAQIRKANTMSVVLVTHNLEIARLSDKVYQLKDGVLVN